MPSKKRKYEARFPPARIKKIMQTDEEIGKVAAAVPVIISRSLEIFLQSLVERTARYTVERKAKTMTTSHLKHCIEHEHQFDFLKDLVDTIADVSNQEEEESGEPGEPKQRRPKRPRVATSDGQLPSHQQTRRRRKKESSTEDDESDEEGGAPSDQDDMPDWSVEQTRSSAVASNHAKKPVGHFSESTSKLNDWEQSNSNAVSHTVPSRMGFPMALQPSSAGDVEDDYDT